MFKVNNKDTRTTSAGRQFQTEGTISLSAFRANTCLISEDLLHPLMHHVPKWSETLEESCSKCCKTFTVCLTILGHYALKGLMNICDACIIWYHLYNL